VHPNAAPPILSVPAFPSCLPISPVPSPLPPSWQPHQGLPSITTPASSVFPIIGPCPTDQDPDSFGCHLDWFPRLDSTPKWPKSCSVERFAGKPMEFSRVADGKGVLLRSRQNSPPECPQISQIPQMSPDRSSRGPCHPGETHGPCPMRVPRLSHNHHWPMDYESIKTRYRIASSS
jgi:hypothetical protein